MFKRIAKWWASRRQPRVWAIKFCDKDWIKAVVYRKPRGLGIFNVIGPFRSECDCEEFVDHANMRLNGWTKYYSPQPVVPKPAAV